MSVTLLNIAQRPMEQTDRQTDRHLKAAVPAMTLVLQQSDMQIVLVLPVW